MSGETQSSEILAYSEGCPRQIIRYAPKIYGFQCHLEITLEGIEKMINACQSDLKSSLYTQTSQILMIKDYGTINTIMVQILERLINREYMTHEEKIAI
jgi:GMP synthase (glutamine-hydrolysing)